MRFKLGGGSFEATLEQRIEESVAENNAENIAETNASIEDLIKRVETVTKVLEVISKEDRKVSPKIATIEEAGKPTRKQVQNSEFSVLIFYRENKHILAKAILSKVLKSGYKSSATQSVLREAKKQYKEGTVSIVWESGTEKTVDDLKEIILSVSPSTKIAIAPAPYDLKRGDVQILLF